MIRDRAYGVRPMKPTRSTNSLPQMTAAEFAAAMKHYGFGVCRARIVDTTGQCRGISWSAVRRGGGSVDRNKTLAKILRERDAEIARRALPGIQISSTSHEGSEGSPAGPSSPPQHAGTRDARHALCKGIGQQRSPS
jgi:hypothetical protein